MNQELIFRSFGAISGGSGQSAPGTQPQTSQMNFSLVTQNRTENQNRTADTEPTATSRDGINATINVTANITPNITIRIEPPARTGNQPVRTGSRTVPQANPNITSLPNEIVQEIQRSVNR